MKKLIEKTRSFRRFDESFHVDISILRDLVDLARLSASAANRQPLKYLIVNTPDKCKQVFPSLAWAGYLENWSGPEEGERPTSYIIILGDRSISDDYGVDHGIAAQSIMLGATERDLGGCMIASVKRRKLNGDLNIPDHLDILLVLALGKTAEKVILEDMKNGNVRYWRDSEDNHHVPKRSLDELILRL